MPAARHTIAIFQNPPRAEVVDFRTYVTVPQAAKILGLSTERVYRLIHTESALHTVETPLGYLISLASVAALRRERLRAGKLPGRAKMLRRTDAPVNAVVSDAVDAKEGER